MENNDREKHINEKEGSEIMEWIKSIALAVIIALFIKKFIFTTTYVSGNSMFPTLENGDRLFATRVQFYFRLPERGEVILFDAPDDSNKKYVKRAIGLPGDTVDIEAGKVYVNGELLEEDYIEEGAYTETMGTSKWEVGPDEIFVLGDNRLPGASKDSRYFGTIDKSTIKGKTKYRIYPFNKFGSIED